MTTTAMKLDSVLVERATKAIFAYVEKKKNGDGEEGRKIALIEGPAKPIITQVPSMPHICSIALRWLLIACHFTRSRLFALHSMTPDSRINKQEDEPGVVSCALIGF
jgi:hypothetical protein